MKIGVVCHPTIGGSGALASELGLWLADQGHELHFISHDVPFRLRKAMGKKIFCHTVTLQHYDLLKYPPYTMALAAKIAEVKKWHQLDIIHVHYAIPHTISAFLAREMCQCGIKVVTTLHGTDVTSIGRDSNYSELTSMALDRCDAVTAVSESLKCDAENYLSLDDIRVIHNFVDPMRFHPGLTSEHFPIDCCESEKVIFHVSNFRNLKRIEDTVQVFHRIRKEVPSHLVLVGDGESMGRVQQQCRALDLEDHVTFLGQQDSVAGLYPRADLFLLNSELESFGLSVLEAMACGVPAVTTNVGGLSEVIEEDVSGHLCELGDVESMALRALHILDEKNHQRYSDAALKRATEVFGIDRIGPEYEGLYRELID